MRGMDEQQKRPPEIVVTPAKAITARNDALDDAVADFLLDLLEREASRGEREDGRPPGR